jgi:hypothetical protein
VALPTSSASFSSGTPVAPFRMWLAEGGIVPVRWSVTGYGSCVLVDTAAGATSTMCFLVTTYWLSTLGRR